MASRPRAQQDIKDKLVADLVKTHGRSRSRSSSTDLSSWRSLLESPCSGASQNKILCPRLQYYLKKFLEPRHKRHQPILRRRERKPDYSTNTESNASIYGPVNNEDASETTNGKGKAKYNGKPKGKNGNGKNNENHKVNGQKSTKNRIVKKLTFKNGYSGKGESEDVRDDRDKIKKRYPDLSSSEATSSEDLRYLSRASCSTVESLSLKTRNCDLNKREVETVAIIHENTNLQPRRRYLRPRLLPTTPTRSRRSSTDEINYESEEEIVFTQNSYRSRSTPPPSALDRETDCKIDSLIYRKHILISPHDFSKNNDNIFSEDELIEYDNTLPRNGSRRHGSQGSLSRESRSKSNVNKDREYQSDDQRSKGDQNQYVYFRKDWRRRTDLTMAALEDHERKIVIEFCHLLEKSKQLFNGLRELPQYGHTQWQSYFGRTFDVYTRLWKFQQSHRIILDSKYGMKRWQIGEIASKIGQLYYHFYLRTSETAYLSEAFSFYYAIRGRSYYTRSNREDGCELMVKKLRYYARFIVVSILLKRKLLVKELVRELELQIIQYGRAYDPEDQIEWTAVLDEVKAFLIAEPGVTLVNPENQSVILTMSGRITNSIIPPIEHTPQMYLTLQDAIIIGSGLQQVKFSELTIDMFRMLQNIEREPIWSGPDLPGDSPRHRGSLSAHIGVLDYGLPPENPHKYLLFKPSPSQILIYLACSCNELPINGALLIYISADGYHPPQNKHAEDYAYDCGGLITTSKTDVNKDWSRESKGAAPKFKEQQVLYPGDLLPFTRKPLFIIVDSDNSYAFQNVTRIFGQPMIILMSPIELPITMSARRDIGSLFTLFLHNPVAAVCHTNEIFMMNAPDWDKCAGLLDDFMRETSRVVTRINIDPVFYAFLGDDFLRTLIFRYIFCELTLRINRNFRARSNLPRISPPLPDELFEQRDLQSIILEIAATIGIKSNFYDTSAPSGPLRSTD